MITKFNHLSWHPEEVPDRIVTAIVKAIQPEKIICYGVRSNVLEAWSCFTYPINVERVTVYDLLIITTEYEKRKEHEILDKLRYYSNTDAVTITAVIHSIKAVNDALKNGSPFFTTVYETGVLLYNHHRDTPLFSPQQKISKADHYRTMKTHWNKWFDLGQKFLHGASYCSSAGWNDLAVFMLHQAVEHTCVALIRIYTGYRPATHNLERLLALTGNFSHLAFAIFPRNTREETDLFTTLSNAYSDARYREEYKVPAEKVAILLERVIMFQSQAQSLYMEKTKSESNITICHPSKNVTYENC